MSNGPTSLRKGPVGVFDSGIGGLTVFKEIRDLLPHEDICYLGDTARVPYGTKSPEVVRRYAELNVRFLVERGAKVVVVACNTASATALEHVTAAFSGVPIIGVVAPVIGHLASLPDIRKIGVIGTATTVRSGMYQSALRDRLRVEVMAKACPLFVPLVEEGILDHPLTMQVIDYYLADLRASGIDTLLLGCTHYPLLRQALSGYFGETVRLVDSAAPTAHALRKLLTDTGSGATGGKAGADHFFVTDTADTFRAMGERFLGRPLGTIEHI